MATQSSILGWRNPGTEEPGGVPQSRTWLTCLSSSSAMRSICDKFSEFPFIQECLNSPFIPKRYFHQVKVKVLVTQSCPTLFDTRLLYPWNSPGKNTGMGCHFLLQGIFPTSGWNPALPHCRQTLYWLSHQGSPSWSAVNSMDIEITVIEVHLYILSILRVSVRKYLLCRSHQNSL